MKISRILSSEVFFFVFFSLFILLVSLSPTIYRYAVAPKDRVFAGTEFYSDDYSVYLSYIREGQQGRWTVIDKHTSEPQNGTLMHEEYLLMGKIGGLLGLSPIIIYHLARFFLGAAFLFTLYNFLRLVLPQSPLLRKTAFFLYLFTTSFPIFNNNPDLQTKWHMSWFMEIEAIERNTVLPHYLLGYIFFLLCAVYFLKSFNSKKLFPRNYLLLIISGNLLAFFHSAELVIFYFTAGFFILFYETAKIITARKIRTSNLYAFLKLIIFIIFTSPFLFYFQSQFSVFPWNYAIRDWEKSTNYYPFLTNFSEYLLAAGPVIIFSSAGLIIFIRQLSKKYSSQKAVMNQFTPNHSEGQTAISNWNNLFLFSWLFSYFFLFYFSYPLLQISQIRFLHNPVLIPLAVFGSLGLLEIARFLSSFLFVLSKIPPKASGGFIIFGLCLLVNFICFPTYQNSLLSKYRTYNDFSTLIYPFKSQVGVFNWLSANTNPDDSVLAAYEASSLIPFMSGNTVFAGHLWSTANYQEKSKLAGNFFSGKMTPEDAGNFLKNGNIRYLYYGFQEYSAGGNMEIYPFLKQIFRNEAAAIYQVN